VVAARTTSIVIYRLKITVFQITCHAVKRLQGIGSLIECGVALEG